VCGARFGVIGGLDFDVDIDAQKAINIVRCNCTTLQSTPKPISSIAETALEDADKVKPKQNK